MGQREQRVLHSEKKENNYMNPLYGSESIECVRDDGIIVLYV